MARTLLEIAMTARDDLDALNDEFNREGSTMHVETYKARLTEIRSRAPQNRELPAPAPVAARPTSAPAATLDENTPVTRGFFNLVLVPVMQAVGRTMKEKNDALIARIKALEDRLPLAYGGVWTEEQQSNKGIFYTDHGSIWYCKETTRDRPGTSAAFTLACKRGSDR